MSHVVLAVAVCAAGAARAAADQLQARPRTTTVRTGSQRALAPSRSDLAVVSVNNGGAKPGGTTTLRGLVADLGPDATASPVTVTVTVPSGASAVGPFFPPSCTANASGSRIVCTFPPGLGSLKTATVQIPVRVHAGVAHGSVLKGGTVTVSSPDDTNTGNNTASYAIRVR
ncbi:DUF11 domain-containing protein [Streptomyces roseochromogenus]|uniref:DUF11 domain-containing protein n=1 Tax=Streptomyces roseochromogenus subsp. oscitans DS 12.976 TaxID=1352936 RepID=V6JV43_STRRC|nr:DUF11 domain-containing protein [Streptomyces roseochromogenus]EST23775.1 hypothetical protein M878_32650 [Streptomyces roseochromogenus subsp. oscitans DS 12.976]